MARGFSKVIIMGNLTRDPEMRSTSNGTQVCSFSVAVNRVYAGNEQVSYFDCSAWGKMGETIAQYCKRGSGILISGRLDQRSYEDKDGNKRIMKGYMSAYKRMYWDEPASTLTQNFQFACSDNKIHPSQSRVLSLYEGLIIQSIASYDYSFVKNGQLVSDGLIRDTIGESVPPKVIDMICKNIIQIEK